MKTGNVASYPNKHYSCCICGKNLGTRFDKLRGVKTQNVTIVEGKEYCDTHYLQTICPHNNTLIDAKALRKGEQRFLECLDCGQGRI